MVEIRRLTANDIQPIAAAFNAVGWDKPVSLLEGYLAEQEAAQRDVLVAMVGDLFAGYLTIVWESGYAPFREANIPEIVDFNVLPKFRRIGIGTQLMDEAESRISVRTSVAGIGVGLTPEYGAAQILYVRRGYIPDGRGISLHGTNCQHGDQVSVDDSLALYFTKELR